MYSAADEEVARSSISSLIRAGSVRKAFIATTKSLFQRSYE